MSFYVFSHLQNPTYCSPHCLELRVHPSLSGGKPYSAPHGNNIKPNGPVPPKTQVVLLGQDIHTDSSSSAYVRSLCGLAGGPPLSPGFGILFSKWMGVLRDPPGPWNPSPSLFLFPSLWGYVSLSGFVSPISLSGSLSSSSVNVHLFHRLLSCLTSKSLSSPTASAILFLSAPRIPVSPAHPFPKPLSIHLENLGRKYLTQNEYP